MSSRLFSRSTSSRASVRRTATALLLVVAIFAAGCGGADEDVADVASDTAEAAVETAATVTDDTSIVEDTEGGQVQVVDSGTPVDLFEWGLATTSLVNSGDVLFSVTNSGTFNHELAIARGASYEELPLLENGAVDEDALGAGFIGRTETFGGGQTIEATFNLEPGDYVLFCNIAVGPNSHAANGQVQSISVG